ncbi:MAG: IPT/TIG domain-containing protein [Sphingorhabdus sp.]
MATPTTITGAEIGLLSYLFEAVGDLLTDAQRKQLTDQLTSLRPAGVAPGDLITAELFNGMLNNVNDLMARVAVLEGAGGGPVITGILPGNVPIPTNSILTITGTGFNHEPNRNIVKLGSRTITEFREGSNESSLSFTVPDVFSDLPKQVDAAVETGGRLSNTFPVNLVAAPRQQIGNFDVAAVSNPSGTMFGGAALSFEWDVFADTALNDELRFELDVANAAGATANQWKAILSFTPAAPAPINVGQTVRVRMDVTAPASATTADVSLRVKGIDDQATGSSQTIHWIAGQPLVVSSPLADFDFTVPAATGAPTDPVQTLTPLIVGGTSFPKGLRVRAGQNGIIRMSRTDRRNGRPELATYQNAAIMETNAAQWTIANGPNPAQHINVAGGASNTFSFRLTNTGGAVDSIVFLRVTSSQTATSGQLQSFTSFVSIPVVIAA